MSYRNKIFKTPKIPYIECRYTINSLNHYKPHKHQCLSIGAIKSGKSEFISKYKKIMLDNKCLVIINPEVVHACNPKNDTARSYYMLYLDTNYCYNLQKSIFSNISSFLPLKETLARDKESVNLYFELVKILFDKNKLILQKEEAIESFCINLFSKYCENRAITKIKYKNKEAVEIVKNYLKNNICNNPSLEELSKIAKTNQYHLIRLFKRYNGMTPHQYLLNLKAEYAKELLAKDMTISSVALEVGLNDQSHLNRVFKSYSACTPKEYKNAISS